MTGIHRWSPDSPTHPSQTPQSGVSGSFSPPLHPPLADLEIEAELEGRWTNRSPAQASREHQGRTGKHGSLDPGPCPGHSSGQTAERPAQNPGQPSQRNCSARPRMESEAGTAKGRRTGEANPTPKSHDQVHHDMREPDSTCHTPGKLPGPHAAMGAKPWNFLMDLILPAPVPSSLFSAAFLSLLFSSSLLPECPYCQAVFPRTRIYTSGHP